MGDPGQNIQIRDTPSNRFANRDEFYVDKPRPFRGQYICAPYAMTLETKWEEKEKKAIIKQSEVKRG